MSPATPSKAHPEVCFINHLGQTLSNYLINSVSNQINKYKLLYLEGLWEQVEAQLPLP